MNQPTHLTNAPVNSTLVAWHTEADIAAYRLENGDEVVYVNGKQMDTSEYNVPGTQIVIGCCMMGKRDLKRFIKENA